MKTAAAVVLVVLVVAGCGGSGDQSNAIAAKIGASTCSAEQFEIQNRLDRSKERIYDCELHARSVCVVEESGIARNVTAEVRLLFANALGGQRPGCLSS